MTVSKLNGWFIGSLLIFSIVLPTVFVWQKTLLLAGAICCSLQIISCRTVRINWKLALIPVFYAILGLAYSIYGVIVGTPGAIRVLTVMVLYPILLSILAFSYKEEDAIKVFRLIVFATWILVVMDLAYLLSNIYAPDNYFISTIQDLYEENAVIDDEQGYFKFTIPNISSLVFLLPFFISAFFSRSNLIGRVNLSFLIFFMMVLAVASGRRALFVAAIAGPLLAVGTLLFSGYRNHERPKKAPKGGYVMVFALLLGLIGFLSYSFGFFDFYFDQVNSIFDFELNDSNRERALQFDSLMDGISAAPFFGNGAGAAASYSRSQLQPWAYELSYLALVFQYGILGFLAYFFGIAFLIFNFIKMIGRSGSSGLGYLFFAGFLSFLIANATNPYLGKFDYMWIIFIPYAIFANEFGKRRS